MTELQKKRKAAREAAFAAITGSSHHDREAAATMVETIIEAARAQVYHEIAGRHPDVQAALRSAGLIA